MSGYKHAVHVFGRSMMGRLGSTHHLQYQWRNKSTPFDTILLTKKQYKEIKELLGPVVETIKIPEESIKITHETGSKYYMRVKRYLIKNNLI